MFQDIVRHIKKRGFRGLILFPLLISLAIMVAPGIFQALYNIPLKESSNEIGSLSGALGMLTTLVVGAFIMCKYDHVGLENLGVKFHRLPKDFLLGGIPGFLSLFAVSMGIYLTGSITIELNPLFAPAPFIIGLFFFMFQGTWEELIFRSFLMPHVAKKYGDTLAIIGTSLLFTLGHALNPGMELMPIINLFVASIVFSLVYYTTGNLIIVGMAHGLWNFSQGFVFGAEVSGNAVPTSLFNSIIVADNPLITGGAFGFEGSVFTLFLGLLLIGIFMYRLKKKEHENEK